MAVNISCVRHGGGNKASRTYGSDTDPAREEEAWILKAAGEVEDVGGYVGVDGVDGEKADHGGLGGVVDEPVGEQVSPSSRLTE